MKTTIFLVVLAVLSANTALVPNPAVPRQVASRTNLIIGHIGPYDRLYYRTYLNQAPLPNAVQTQDVVFRGTTYNNITAVYALEVGYTQYAQAWILSGGIGRNNVTVRAQSARGYGFYYQVEVWGR
ncbi:uncharacterized protein LOC113230527 [Hyposmocoma kahamanoa]|uniref:uncharacterized protein LOC113230527 n=1 Tax=Hyposmocoma kahamanoa TaxID=1477025 RepID=UPI000E6DA299|nr:uncharacterized protein LOC113230527 [Hyposmocoma kahamanoa]